MRIGTLLFVVVLVGCSDDPAEAPFPIPCRVELRGGSNDGLRADIEIDARSLVLEWSAGGRLMTRERYAFDADGGLLRYEQNLGAASGDDPWLVTLVERDDGRAVRAITDVTAGGLDNRHVSTFDAAGRLASYERSSLSTRAIEEHRGCDEAALARASELAADQRRAALHRSVGTTSVERDFACWSDQDDSTQRAVARLCDDAVPSMTTRCGPPEPHYGVVPELDGDCAILDLALHAAGSI